MYGRGTQQIDEYKIYVLMSVRSYLLSNKYYLAGKNRYRLLEQVMMVYKDTSGHYV